MHPDMRVPRVEGCRVRVSKDVVLSSFVQMNDDQSSRAHMYGHYFN